MTQRYDDFNRADSSSSLGSPSDGGSGYTIYGGGGNTFGISSNKAYCFSAPNPVSVAALDTGSADMDQAVTFATAGISLGFGLAVRVQDADNFWVALNNSGVWKLRLHLGGNDFDDPNTYTAAAANGDVVRTTCTGSGAGAIKVYINGTLRITSSQFETFLPSATKAGLYSFFDTTVRYDDFGPPSSPPPPPSFSPGRANATKTTGSVF